MKVVKSFYFILIEESVSENLFNNKRTRNSKNLKNTKNNIEMLKKKQYRPKTDCETCKKVKFLINILFTIKMLITDLGR
jgi:hypothetical protein